MRLIAWLSTFITLVLALTIPLGAQDREGVMGDLIRDVAAVETKIVGLAKTMPTSALEPKIRGQTGLTQLFWRQRHTSSPEGATLLRLYRHE
jgi:hypothetical protein